MATQLNDLLILEDDVAARSRLVSFLELKFPKHFNILTFETGDALVGAVNSKTAVVILDYDLKGERGDLILKKVKNINNNTEVIILSSEEDVATAIDAFHKGAKSYVSKNTNTHSTLQRIISGIIEYPAAIVQRFFGVNQVLSIFIVQIIYVGLVVFIGYQLLM